ncbi:MAG TPA: hypothetical protein VG675_09060 [Bryobacteraceae bacterium]|nr:hypothetical protein [Bryobacteraceae bacterium]
MSISSLLAKAPAGRTLDPKVACTVVLALVFLAGAATGALAMNLGLHDYLHQPTFDTAAGKALYFEHMQKELALSPGQSQQLESILDDFWQYYRTVLSDSKARIEQVLNPAQRKKFDQMLQDHQRP